MPLSCCGSRAPASVGPAWLGVGGKGHWLGSLLLKRFCSQSPMLVSVPAGSREDDLGLALAEV